MTDNDLKQQLIQQGVKYAIASYVDMHGVSKAKMVPIAHYHHMMQGSELFTGAALDGVPQEINDEEISAHTDAESCIVLPWQADTAWFASDLWCGGQPFAACSRNILNRVLAKATHLGYRAQLGMEAEFFVFRDCEKGGFEPASSLPHLEKPAYDMTRQLENMPWLGELVDAMNQLGWDVYSFDHEDGIGQFELDFDYADARTMADRFVFFRFMANAIARRHGLFASFMPKPYGERTGSGAHYNMSLADAHSGQNLFIQPDDPRGCKLSKLGYHYIAGVLKHLPAIMAVVAPTVNSYKRLIKQGSMSGFTWAPIYACYGNNNRTNAIRIPLAGGRVELRAADSACNPYLGAAMTIAAGLEGIEQQLDPGEPNMENMYLLEQAELERRNIARLPETLQQAVAAFAADPLSREVFGEAMFTAWCDYKHQEWHDYLNHVSDWEHRRYLKFF